MNSKQIYELNIRTKTINILQNVVGNLYNLEFGNGFIGLTTKAQITKEKQINWAL